jgi:nucleoid-associated protein YgaU
MGEPDFLDGLDEIRKWRKKAKDVDIDQEVEDIKQQRAALAKKREAEGTAKAEPKAEAEAKVEADEPRIYVVKSGDSLSKIAKEVYGKAGRWKEIYEANKDQIKDPNLIYRGQKLRIP